MLLLLIGPLHFSFTDESDQSYYSFSPGIHFNNGGLSFSMERSLQRDMKAAEESKSSETC